mgnify:CR=1 FL=1
MAREIIVVGEDDWTQRAVALITDAADNSIRVRGRFRIALSGGATPRPVYAALATTPGIDWPRWELFWSDERTVPPTSPDSNYGMARAMLLDPLAAQGVTPGRIERMRGELEPAEAAGAYEEIVRSLAGAPFPRFDLIQLGIGGDAHTASLFPHTAALDTAALVVANAVPRLKTVRLTFTFPLINAARYVLMLVNGANKAGALRDVLEGPRDFAQWPAQAIQPGDGRITWLLDRSAAQYLDPGSYTPR